MEDAELSSSHLAEIGLEPWFVSEFLIKIVGKRLIGRPRSPALIIQYVQNALLITNENVDSFYEKEYLA